MRKHSIQGFSGVNTAVDPKLIPDGAAQRAVNVRVEDGQVKPAYGYKNLEASQASAVFGLGYLQGYSGSTELEEYVSAETVAGNTRFYSREYTGDTLASVVEITNGASNVNVHASEWAFASYDDDAFFINPNNTSPIYRHTVGTANSLTAVAVPTAPDPTTGPLTYSIALGGGSTPYTQLSWAGLDPTNGTEMACTGAATNTGSALTASNEISVRHTASTTGESSFEPDLSLITAGQQNWQYNDFFAITLTPETAGFEINNVRFQFTNGDGSPKVLVPDQVGPSGNVYVFGWSDKTRADFDNIDKIKVSYNVTKSNATAANNDLIVSKPFVGGIILNSGLTGSGADTQTFAYSYYYSTPAFESGLSGKLLVPAEVLRGYMPIENRNWRLGGLGVHLDLIATVSADANVDNCRFYILNEKDDTWHRLGTQSDADLSFEVRVNYVEAIRLPEYAPAPFDNAVFNSNVTNALAYKGSMVWMYGTGYQNIRYSRVGDPLRQAADTDDTEDDTRGATFTLADNAGDSPLGGIQAGDAVMIAGRYGVYAQFGDFPAQMTPPRKVSGSFGVAGKKAFCRAKTDSGIPGMAYVSRDGQVYFAFPGGFAGQETGDNVLLSDPIRDGYHSLREWLITGQPELSLTDFSTANIVYDEAQEALIVVMGKRGMILRRPGIDGTRNWEPRQWNTGSNTRTIRYIASSPKRRIRWLRSTGEFDEHEWNTATSSYIEGLLRDGGNTMPTPKWRSKRFYGPNSRLSYVKAFRDDNEDAPLLRWYCTRVPLGVDISIPAATLGARPSHDAQGSWGELEIEFHESDGAIHALELELTPCGNARDR